MKFEEKKITIIILTTSTLYNLKNRMISKIMNMSIRCTYYIFCRQPKDWTDPALMDFEHLFPLTKHCISFRFVLSSLVLSRNSLLHTARYKRCVFVF